MGGRTRDGARERLIRLGPGALTESELIAVLFGGRARGESICTVAERLLAAGGGLRALVQSDPQELCAWPGLGPARATQMLAALELGRRAHHEPERRRRLCSPAEIHLHLRPSLAILRREEFHVLCLNSRNLLLRDAKVAEGTMNSCPVDPREVFAPAVTARASGIVLAHNHPSGDPEPSARDLALTRQLWSGARLLGIRLLDHVIVGDGAYASMLERGLLPADELQAAADGWVAHR
ncbi:MAG: DNA repair protein RadC [Myxococcales bacterium]|nr:DNA repair protein RadC [Myxococcales bacterium]